MAGVGPFFKKGWPLRVDCAQGPPAATFIDFVFGINAFAMTDELNNVCKI